MASSSTTPVSTSHIPAVTQYVEKPALIYENIRKEQVEEIQPVIHREHERTEVRQITQPIIQGIMEPVRVEDKELPAQIKPPVQASSIPINTSKTAATPLSTQSTTTATKVIEKPPIIVDTDNNKIVEEIQPVIYRTVLQPSVVRETLPIFEKVVESPVLVQQTRFPQYITAPLQQQPSVASQQSLYQQQVPFQTQQSQQLLPQQFQSAQGFQFSSQSLQPQVQILPSGAQTIWPTQQLGGPVFSTQQVTRTVYTTTTPVAPTYPHYSRTYYYY